MTYDDLIYNLLHDISYSDDWKHIISSEKSGSHPLLVVDIPEGSAQFRKQIMARRVLPHVVWFADESAWDDTIPYTRQTLVPMQVHIRRALRGYACNFLIVGQRELETGEIKSMIDKAQSAEILREARRWCHRVPLEETKELPDENNPTLSKSNYTKLSYGATQTDNCIICRHKLTDQNKHDDISCKSCYKLLTSINTHTTKQRVIMENNRIRRRNQKARREYRNDPIRSAHWTNPCYNSSYLTTSVNDHSCQLCGREIPWAHKHYAHMPSNYSRNSPYSHLYERTHPNQPRYCCKLHHDLVYQNIPNHQYYYSTIEGEVRLRNFTDGYSKFRQRDDCFCCDRPSRHICKTCGKAFCSKHFLQDAGTCKLHDDRPLCRICGNIVDYWYRDFDDPASSICSNCRFARHRRAF